MECVSVSSQPFQPRNIIVAVNSNEPIYYSFSVSVNKCSGSCNTTDDSYGRICVPNKANI